MTQEKEMVDATTEIDLRVLLTVRVRGEYMAEEELAAILTASERALERQIADRLRITDFGEKELGWTPDGNRQAYLDELLSVDLVEVLERP